MLRFIFSDENPVLYSHGTIRRRLRVERDRGPKLQAGAWFISRIRVRPTVNDDIHVVPNNGRHEESANCFCCPVLIYKDEFTAVSVWSHNDETLLN